MIADFLPGFALELHDANGVAFPEHPLEDDENQPDKTVVKYLEISSGTNFVIHIDRAAQFAYPDEHLGIAIRADGTKLKPRICEPGHVVEFRGELSGSWGNWQEHPYTFASLTTTEDQANDAWKAIANGLGEIELEVYRVKVERVDFVEESPFLATAGEACKTGVPEKALKGRCVSTHVSLPPDGVPFPGQCRALSISFPYGKIPIATIIFKYATRRDLQSQGIIPREPSPVPLEERDPNTLTLEETRELLSRVQQQRDEMSKRIKRERQDSVEPRIVDNNEDSDAEVQFVDKRRCTVKTTTIDLTDDE